MRTFTLALVIIVGVHSTSIAQTKSRGNVGAHDGINSGEAGARAGTLLYNSMNPKTPLPLSSGNVVPDTVKNLGAQQSPKAAWSNSARSNSGLK